MFGGKRKNSLRERRKNGKYDLFGYSYWFRGEN